jgi:Protein of unknown function (DUF3631)
VLHAPDDREADTWEALIAVADAAGGDWPHRARVALTVMCSAAGAADEERSLGVRLLRDIRGVFDGDAMHGETIVGELRKLDEAPWGDFYGRDFNQRDMAKLLAPYGVKSVDVKIGGVNKKGYRRDHLYDAWSRYLPPPGVSAASATSATALFSDGAEVAGSGQQALPATGVVSLTCGVAEVALVAHTPECAACHGPMTIIRPAQRYHPICEPDSPAAAS